MNGIQISRKLVLVNAASSMVRKALMLTVLVWLQQHLIRRIDEDEYALYPVLTSLMLAFPLITSFFMSGLRRYVTEAYARGDEVAVTRFVSSMMPALAKLSVFTLVVGGVCAWRIDDLLTISPRLVGDAQIMFAMLVVTAAARIFAAPFMLGFHLRQRFVLGNVLGLTVELLRVVLLFALLAISTRVLWVVTALFVSGLYDFAITSIVSRRLVPALRFRRDLVEPGSVKPLLGFGGWAVVNQIGLVIRNAADPIVLNQLAGPLAVQSFYIGSLPDTNARRFSIEATATAQPAVTAMFARGEHGRLGRTFLRLSRYSLWAMAFLAAPMIVFRHEFLRLYLVEEYEANVAAATVLLLLMARYVVIFPNTVVGMVAVARAEIKAIAIRALAISLVNLALTFVLVGAYGMGAAGSAWATFAVTIVGAPLLMWPLGLRLAGVRFATWLKESIVPGLIPALGATPVWLLMRSFVPADSWLTLAVDAAVGVGAYAALLYAFALRPRDREELREGLTRVRAKLARA